MAYKWRDEIVGKRFLCVTTVSSSKIKVKKINEWNWRQGIIRASNRSHTKHNDLTVLVEYDGVDWRKREWIKVYDQQFHVFLIEYNIVWSTRADTVLGKNKQWLALNFKILVDKVGLRDSQLKPIEYLDDRQLDFVDYNALKLYEDFDLTKDPYKSVSCLQKYIRQWTEYQDSQKILLTTPSVLVGYRVKVYRSEGTTQWYTAVIVSYNENTKELTLTDDTVLEERNEDPTLVQMKLIGDGVVESILKGEEIGITPRRRACNQNSRETTTATSLNNSVNANNNYVNSNARKLTNPSNNNSTNHHPNRVKNSNLVNNLSNINVSTTTTVTTNTSTTTTTSTVNSRVNSHNDNNNNSLTTNNCNDDNIRNNKHINTGNEKEIAVKTNNKSSKHSDSNCIGSVMNSSVTKADVNNSNFDSSLKSNYHRFGLDLSDQQAHGLQSKAQKNENQEYQQHQQQQANNQDQVNQQQRNTSVRLNNSHNHLGSNFSSVTTTSTTSKTNSQSKSSSASPTSSINSTTYSNSLMHLHMTPSQSGSHLPRPPCPPNGDRTTGPPSTSIASSIHHQQQHHQQHHLHHQQQQQHIQQSHHHLSSQPSSSIPKSSASSLDSQNSSTMSRPPPGIISPYSNAIGNYQAMLMLQHQQELLWQKYPEMRGMTASSANPDNRLLTPYQINDWKMIQERERDNRQLQEKMKLEDKMRERLEREAKDRESKERDKFLKERAEKEKKQREAVDQHFVESLRLANQKQRAVTTGWPQMGKGNSGNPNHPPPPQSPVRSQQQSQPAVSSSGNNSLPRSYIPMFNGDAEKESGESKSANSSNCSSRSSSSATSSHQPNNNNVNNNNNSNNNNSNNNNNNNNNSNSNNMVHSDARLIRNLEQRHHQQQTPQTPKSQQQSRSGNKVDYRSSESNLSHLHAAAAAQQFSVLSQQQSHSPNGPQHPLHLIHAPSWGVPRSGVSSDGGSPSQGKGSQSHQPGHPGALPLHLQSHHGPIGPGQINPSQLQFVNNMSVNGSRLLAHYDAKISSLMRENSSSPSLSTTSKKTNASPVNTNNNSNNSNSNNNTNNPRDNNNGSNSVNSIGSRSDPSKLGPNHRANSENLGPYGYTPYGYPPPPPRSSGIKDTPPPHPPPPPSLPPPHLAVGKLNSSTNISNPSAPNSRNCFSPMGNSLGRPPSGPSPSRPPPPAHSGGSSSSIISGPEKREPSPLIDRSGTPLGRNTGTPLGRPSSASSSKHLSGKVAHQFNSVDRISPLYHNSGSQSSSSSTSSLQSGQQGQPSGPPHSSSLFSQQTQLSGVPLMSAPPAHQSSSPGLATSRSNTPQLSSSNVQSHQPVVLSSSTNSSSSSAANHPSLTTLTSSSSSLPSSQDQPQNLVKSEVKVRNNLNSVNSNSQSLSNSNVSSKGQHLQGSHTPSYMKHSQFKAEEHKSNLINSSDRYSINGPNMDTSKQQQQQHFTPISNAGVMSGGPGGGMYPHYMKGLSPSRYNLSSGQSVSPHVMGYEVSRSRTSGPNMPYNLTHPSNSFDGQLKGPNDHLAGGNNKAMNMNSFKVNSDVRMSAETINLDTHQAHSHHSGKGSSSIPSFSGNNTITISPASAATTLTITTSPLTSISPTGTIVKSGANSSNNGTRLVPGNLPSGYLPSNIHPMMGQSNHHLSTHSHHGQSSSHPISLTNNKTPLGPMTGPPVSNGSSGSIIHGLPVTSDKKGLSVSPSMTISTKDSIEYEQGKRKGMHKEVYDVTKKIKKEDEDNVNNRSGNGKSMGRLAASPTEFVHQTSPLSNAQPIILIKEEKNVYPLNENKKSPLTNHFEHDFGDHKIQPTFNSSKSTIETPMTITSTMLPPPSLNTSTVFSNSSPITPATSTPSTQSGSTTSITISTPVTTVRESPTTVTSNEPSTPSKFHPKLKKAWLQRHSEAEVESNSNQSTSSALSVNNTLNNLTSNSVKEEERCKQPSPSIHKSQQSHHHKTKPSSQIKSDQHSDASASSSPRVKRKISREEKNKKRSKKDPSSDEDGDETSSVSDFDFNGDKSNSSAPEKSKSSKSGLIKKRITSRNTSKRHKGSGGSNSGSGSENKKDDYKWSKDERERRRKTKESKINARRGRKPKSSTRGSKESKELKEPKEPKEPKELKEPKESKESNGNKDSFREKESKKKSSKEGSLVLRPTSVEVLKKTGQPFLQDGSCYDIAPRLPKCRECRMTPNQRNKKMPNIFCRFYAFRKLKYGKNGVVTDSGFSEPQDASNLDCKLWLPPEESCSDLDMETSKFLIKHVGDQFCDLVKQEQQALKMHMGKDKTITWKRVVQGVREMCDVCETTLFNIHWVCHKCGFVICIDCYKARKTGAVKEEVNPPRDRDEYQWLLCTNRQPHEQDKLMMTQIIASTALNDVGKMLHMIRKIYSIPAHCGCDTSSIVGANGLSIKMPDVKALRDKMESSNGKKGDILNGGVKGDSKSDAIISKDSENSTLTGFSSESGSSPLSWLADVALSSSKLGSDEAGKDSQSAPNDGSSAGKSDAEEKSKEETDEHNFSTLRELLIRPTSKKGKGSKKRKKKGSQDADNNENDVNDAEEGEDNEEEDDENDETTSDEGEPEDIRVKKKTKKDECDDKTSSNLSSSTSTTTTGPTSTTTTSSSAVSNTTVATNKTESIKLTINSSSLPKDEAKRLEHYRRLFIPKRGIVSSPSRSCSVEETKKLFPNIPHTWLCSGRLLVLQDPKLSDNLKLFQEQWKRGQPVLVNGVSKLLDPTLWSPEEFNKSFGDSKNDLVNCKTGHVLPKLPMKKFWDGFENLNKRMKGEDGDFMTLKLKDWPPGDDFSDLLPDHYADLMECLPLPEYTRRDGCLNLAGRLPECFVRPDLGPKMYNAYGSALLQDKGTTNLHLDISDAVNIMVYVGVPKGGSKSEDFHEIALKALDEGGCDEEMKKRCREKGNKLGALWHIYEAKNADAIRDLLNKIAKERGVELGAHHDPIHDQSWYLDSTLRARLKSEYGVEGYAIAQCLGDAVFIPAGAPHQVRNLQSCIKVAGDFVSPENVTQCFNLTQEFRQLSDSHINHEDKLQIKNIIYHAIKDSLASLAVSDSNKSTSHNNNKSCSVSSKSTNNTSVNPSTTPTSTKAH